MRPRIVDALDAALGTSVFERLVPSPATMYPLAMVTAVLALQFRTRRVPELRPYHSLGVTLWTMVGALVGARVFHLLQHLSDTLADPGRILDLAGPTTSWGAYLGGAAGLVAYGFVRRLRILLYADVVATTIGLAIALGRWACFLNGDDFGTAAGLPWTVRFPHGSYPFAAQARAGLISPLDDLSLPVHPVQLYFSASGLALFFLTGWFWQRYRHRPGATLCFFWLCDALTRFALEFFRGDHNQFLLGLAQSQAFCIVIGMAATIGLARAMRRTTTTGAAGAFDNVRTVP